MKKKTKEKDPLWKPDKNGEYHLGDLMYRLEELKQKDKENARKRSNTRRKHS
jgi:hypothetical protein